MKSKNAKRIAAVAASLLMGFAVAGSGGVTYGTIPIINNAGTPVVQIVVGSGVGSPYTPAPSDGVVAANIAAVIGNLAFTSQAVTASVSNTGAVSCVVTTPKCSLTNAQVWLGESGLSGGSGNYAFYALIGSVLNGAIALNLPGQTKSLQGAGQYTYPEVGSLLLVPSYSPYTAAGSVPSASVSSTSNGGGVSFNSGFSATTGPNNDNILRVTSAQLSGLVTNYGTHSQSTYLWVAGFPVFDQASGVNNFRIFGATGAYQTVFGNPIQINGNATSSTHIMSNLNVPIQLLGQNYTILKAYSTSTTISQANANVVNGGKIELAAALSNAETVYVGHNITTGPFVVSLQDLGQPTSNGISPASIGVYYNGVLTNTTSITPGSTTQFNISGQKVFVNVQSTFAGLYAYQKWAKMQVYSNVLNLTDNQQFNQTLDPGWKVNLYWTNTTAGSGANAVALSSIVVYNTSPATLAPGQSLTFIQNPAHWKFTFVGDTLTQAGYDSVSINSQSTQTVNYQNLGTIKSQAVQLSIRNVSASGSGEPTSELTVTSQIPNAFSSIGTPGSQVVLALNPYELNENGNLISPATGAMSPLYLPAAGFSNVVLTDDAPGASKWISATNPLTVTIWGYTSNTANQNVKQASATFTSNGGNAIVVGSDGNPFFNVTTIQLNRALPGNVVVQVWGISLTNTANGIDLANLSSVGSAAVIYGPLSGQTYYSLSATAAGNILYNPGNGQAPTSFALTPTVAALSAVAATGTQQYYSFSINEIAVTSNSAIKQSSFAFGIVNSTGGPTASPLFQLNYSASTSNTPGTKNNVTYTPTNSLNAAFNVQPGFVSERGSKITAISPSTVTFNLAKTPDQLLFVVGPVNGSATSTTTNYGPYKVGQATNLPNVTIANVSANCTGGSAGSGACTVTGLGNLTATPSVTQAVTPVSLNTAADPLVVLDTNANQSATLIVIGSKYVNSVAGQIFQDTPNLDSSFGPGSVISQAEGQNRILVAGYTANDTVNAGNMFIGQLLNYASQQGQ